MNVYIDTETSGLDPQRNEIWEIALVSDDDEDAVWLLPVDLSRAEPDALRIGRFYERWSHTKTTPLVEAADAIARLTAGAHLVGVNPAFDAAFLSVFLRANGYCPAWEYHLVDVLALAAGKLAAEPPWSSRVLSTAVGVNPEDYDRHTALGDACWAKAIYEAVIGK